MNTFRMLALSEAPLEKTLAGLMKHSPNVGSVDTVVVNDQPRQYKTIYNDAHLTDEVF